MGGRVVNQVNAFFVRELGKYLILGFSLFEISPASIKYLATCSTVDSVVSPENLVNLGTLHLGGKSVCNTYSDSGDVKLGLWKPVFIPFCIMILSIMAVKLFSKPTFWYWIC